MSKLIGLGMLLLFGSFHFQAKADENIDINQRYGYRQVVRCASRGYNYNECYVGRRMRVHIARQVSRSSCVRGQSWGYQPRRGVIWVSNGCRADFVIDSRRGGWWDPESIEDDSDLNTESDSEETVE